MKISALSSGSTALVFVVVIDQTNRKLERRSIQTKRLFESQFFASGITFWQEPPQDEDRRSEEHRQDPEDLRPQPCQGSTLGAKEL